MKAILRKDEKPIVVLEAENPITLLTVATHECIDGDGKEADDILFQHDSIDYADGKEGLLLWIAAISFQMAILKFAPERNIRVGACATQESMPDELADTDRTVH